MYMQQRPSAAGSLRQTRKKKKHKDAGSMQWDTSGLIEHEEPVDTHDNENGNFAIGRSLEENTNKSTGKSHERHEESHKLPTLMCTACPKTKKEFILPTAESDVSNDKINETAENFDQKFERRTQQRSSIADDIISRRKKQRNEKSKSSTDLEFEEKYITTDEAIENEHESVFQCFECVLLLPVSHVDEIEPGDHVVFSGLIYNHHGIIISKEGDKLGIIEATNSICGALLGIFKIFGGKAEIVKSDKTLDFKKKKICVVKYNERLSPEDTISRACNFNCKDFKYNLFRNNCEHFATHCVTGRRISVQVSKLKLAWKLFWKSGFVGMSNESERNEKGFEKNMICKNCYQMNKTLLSVEKLPIKSRKDIEEGDIIQYRYWNLWHDAVILAIDKKTATNVVCTIAHYAFRGPFFHRILKDDKLNIRLNGKCFKLDYSSPKYNVYPPEEVVGRALEEISDQRQPFVFFANDSSHFARWCKLKPRHERS